MKKLFLSLALLVAACSVMAQSAEDKAKAKAEAAALKAAQKQARSQMAEAQKVLDALTQKIQDTEKPVTEDVIMEDSKKGLGLISAALESGHIDERKFAEAYKISESFAVNLHNLYIAAASQQQPFDTVAFLPNLKKMTDGIHMELKHTKVIKGETGNEAYLKQKQEALSKSKVYYIYAAQFESECQRYENSLKAYDYALSFTTDYPEIANSVVCPIGDGQIAYYAYYTAHDAKNFKLMDKYYEQALTFEQGAEGVMQLATHKYLEQGDTVKWAEALKAQALKEPAKNEESIQRLLAYYQHMGLDKMVAFADEVLAVAPESRIANYGKGYALFTEKKYEEALVCYKRCSEADPTYYDSWYQAGMCKYRQAIDLNSTIDGMKDQKKAKETKEQTKNLFADAIPFFEKARECTPDEPSKWAYELKLCYTATGDKAKADEMDKLL